MIKLSLKNIFVHAKKSSNITCFKCENKGHKSYMCKTPHDKRKMIWVPKEIVFIASNHEGPKKAWVPKIKK